MKRQSLCAVVIVKSGNTVCKRSLPVCQGLQLALASSIWNCSVFNLFLVVIHHEKAGFSFLYSQKTASAVTKLGKITFPVVAILCAVTIYMLLTHHPKGMFVIVIYGYFCRVIHLICKCATWKSIVGYHQWFPFLLKICLYYDSSLQSIFIYLLPFHLFLFFIILQTTKCRSM